MKNKRLKNSISAEYWRTSIKMNSPSKRYPIKLIIENKATIVNTEAKTYKNLIITILN